MKTKTPDSLMIQQYLEGTLNPKLAHELEKQALDDPFLSDALEGYSVYKDPAADLSILQRQLHERIVHMQENKKVFDLSWQRLSVAAAAAVMFISAGILFWMNSQNSTEKLASQSHKPVEVNVIDKDSVAAILQSKDEHVIASLKKSKLNSSQPTLSEYKPVKEAEKSIVVSSESENVINDSREVASSVETNARTVEASPTVAAASRAKISRLQDDNQPLNEIVVSDYKYAPENGWLQYKQYLDLNTKNFKGEPKLTGSVLLSFQVGSDGKPTNIKVIKSLNVTYDSEAIRIVKNGPLWTPALDGTTYPSHTEVSF